MRRSHAGFVAASGVEQQRATDGRTDRPALHPWRRGHPGAGATSLASHGTRATPPSELLAGSQLTIDRLSSLHRTCVRMLDLLR
jgi:hypothetical protein